MFCYGRQLFRVVLNDRMGILQVEIQGESPMPIHARLTEQIQTILGQYFPSLFSESWSQALKSDNGTTCSSPIGGETRTAIGQGNLFISRDTVWKEKNLVVSFFQWSEVCTWLSSRVRFHLERCLVN